jgi:putative endonuclease
MLQGVPRHERSKRLQREKQLKNGRRDWKIQLIEKDNLDWSDLSHLL